MSVSNPHLFNQSDALTRFLNAHLTRKPSYTFRDALYLESKSLAASKSVTRCVA